MAFRQRQINGTVVDGDGSPVANAEVKFKPTKPLAYTPTHIVVDTSFSVQTDVDGNFTIDIWCDEDSLVAVDYNVYFPVVDGGEARDDHSASFSLQYGDASPINLAVLINASLPAPTEEEQLYTTIQEIVSEANDVTATLTNKSMSGASNTFSNIPQSAINSLLTDVLIAKQVFFHSPIPTAQTAAAGATTYSSVYAPGNNNTFNTEVLREVTAYVAGTLINFTVVTSTAQPASGSLELILRINGVDTLCTVTVPSGAAAGTFINLSFAAVALPLNARMAIKIVNNASSASAGIIHTTIVLQR